LWALRANRARSLLPLGSFQIRTVAWLGPTQEVLRTPTAAALMMHFSSVWGMIPWLVVIPVSDRQVVMAGRWWHRAGWGAVVGWANARLVTLHHRLGGRHVIHVLRATIPSLKGHAIALVP
jgi:hypothetical protein